VRLLLPLLLSFAAILPGVGALAGRLVPRRAERPAAGRARGLGLLAAALALALPLAGAGEAGAILPLEVADAVLAQLAVAGAALLLWLRLRSPGELAGLWAGLRGAAGPAALALAALFLLLQPFGLVLHRLTLTPERGLAFALCAAGLLPFTLAASLLLRRGSALGAALAALAGRALVMLSVALGVWLGLLEPVALFVLPPFVLVSLFLEALAAPLYALSRNVLAIALVDAGWLALVLAATLPIRI
jgi:hypothetical protein